MKSRSFILFTVSGLLLHLCGSCVGRRTWDYELVSVSATSSDESKVNVSARIQRVGRDQLTLSGVLDWKFDIDETTMVDLIIYSSNSGGEKDFIESPYNIPKMTFFDFLKKYYQDIWYKSYGKCMQLPDLKDNFKTFPKKTYVFNRCIPDDSGFPDVLPAVYYKLVFKMTGPVEMCLSLVVKLTSKFLG